MRSMIFAYSAVTVVSILVDIANRGVNLVSCKAKPERDILRPPASLNVTQKSCKHVILVPAIRGLLPIVDDLSGRSGDTIAAFASA